MSVRLRVGAIRRAGADAIITYFAVEAARILRGAVHGGA
jgi:delta-aminolevulinic acid dehydratase/porphobilinogen synthase